jgi:hypothetical protein
VTVTEFEPLPGDLEAAPWEQRPKETPEEYALFLRYRDLPLPRSLRDLSDLTGLPLLELDETRHTRDWPDRAWAHDLVQEERAAHETAIRAQQQRAGLVDLTEALAAKCLVRAREHIAGMEPGGDRTKLGRKMAEAERLLNSSRIRKASGGSDGT